MADNRTESDFSKENQPSIQVFKRKYKRLQDKSQALEEEIERIKKEIANQRSKCIQSVSEINRIAGQRLTIDEKIVIKPEFILQKNDKPKEFLHFLVKNYADMEAQEKALKNHYNMVESLVQTMSQRLKSLTQKAELEKSAYAQENNELCEQYITMKEKYENQLVENQGIKKSISQTMEEITNKHTEIQTLQAEIQALKPGYSKIKSNLLSRKEYEQEKRNEYTRIYNELRHKAEEQEKELRKYQQRIDYLQKFKEEAQMQSADQSTIIAE